MISLCRSLAARNFDPALFVQPLHATHPPRRYRTIVVCGVFGLGSTRAGSGGAAPVPGAASGRWNVVLDNETPRECRTLAVVDTWRRQRLPAPWPFGRTASRGRRR
jgi:hypothetical protein